MFIAINGYYFNQRSNIVSILNYISAHPAQFSYVYVDKNSNRIIEMMRDYTKHPFFNKTLNKFVQSEKAKHPFIRSTLQKNDYRIEEKELIPISGCNYQQFYQKDSGQSASKLFLYNR